MLLPHKFDLSTWAKPGAFMDKVRSQKGHSLSFTLGELLIPFGMAGRDGAGRVDILLNVFVLLSVVNVRTDAHLDAALAAARSVYFDPRKFGCEACLARGSVCTRDWVEGR